MQPPDAAGPAPDVEASPDAEDETTRVPRVVSRLVEDEPGRSLDPKVPVVAASSETRTVPLDERRYHLALWILSFFGFASAGVLVLLLLLPEARLAELRSIAPLILSPLATLAGTGAAWFYADRQGRSGNQS